MKLEKYVDVSIDLKTGEISVEGFNFIGKTCIKEMEFVKDAVGHTTTRRLKPEYHKQAKVAVHKHIPICG